MKKNNLQQSAVSILCVCTGNICRSPTAEAVFAAQIQERKVSDWVRVDSAGTHRYHIGDAPDSRAIRIGHQRGYDLSQLRARHVADSDFSQFDYIFFMDDANAAALRARCPSEALDKLHYLAEFGGLSYREIDDPYYGGEREFIRALDEIESAVSGALNRILAQQSK